MMACNDLGLADHTLKLWHGEHETRRRRQVGAKMFFVRLEIAHMFEAFSIIQHIRDNADLSQAVSNCDRRTRQSFDEVVEAIDSDDWKRMLRIRNNITFHYGEGVTKKAFKTALSSYLDTPWEISLGDYQLTGFLSLPTGLLIE
jgi:hypothetical protein